MLSCRIMPHLSDADWAVTTVAIFVERLRLIRDTKLSASGKELFTIRSSDLESVAEPFFLALQCQLASFGVWRFPVGYDAHVGCR